jgi:hypothetical protein
VLEEELHRAGREAEELRRRLAATEAELARLQEILETSVAIRAVHRLWSLKERLFPEGTRRRALYDAALARAKGRQADSR